MARKPSDVVPAADRREWAIMSRDLAERRHVMSELREAEARQEVLDEIAVNDLAWADNELMEARRFESYGW